MPKPNILKCTRRHAWTSIDEDGEEVHHIKTVDEHGATVGEHLEGGIRGIKSWTRVLSGRPITMPSAVEDVFGMLPLSSDCRESRERRRLNQGPQDAGDD